MRPISLGLRELGAIEERKWKNAGKGKGNRWLMLRDIVGVCAIRPWTTTELEDLMICHRGLRHRTTFMMIAELVRAKALEEIEEERGKYLRATEQGVNLFLGSRKALPASFVQAVLTSSDALESVA